MKLRLTILIFLLATSLLQAQPKWRLSYVQPLTGTANSTTAAALKHGEGTERLANTIPAVGTPFAMTQWTPQTRTSEQKCLAPYYYKDEKLSGFRGSHWLSGSCTQDYGSVTIMPLKYYDNSALAFNNLQNTVRAIDYAVKQIQQFLAAQKGPGPGLFQ